MRICRNGLDIVNQNNRQFIPFRSIVTFFFNDVLIDSRYNLTIKYAEGNTAVVRFQTSREAVAAYDELLKRYTDWNR